MASDDNIELEGEVTKLLKGGMFEVTIPDNGMKVTCKVSGKLYINKIRILVGDTVTINVSPYDLTKGRITWRNK